MKEKKARDALDVEIVLKLKKGQVSLAPEKVYTLPMRAFMNYCMLYERT